MTATGRSKMAVVHNGFRAALAIAPALINGAAGDDARRARVGSFFASTLALIEAHHREEEEALFPLLIERIPEERMTVDVGIEEHHRMLSLLAAAKASVTEWVAAGDHHSLPALSALAAFNDAFAAHMDHEEATIVPLLEEHLTEETWTKFEEQLRARLPLLAELLLPVAFGLSLLWEAVGEASFKDLIGHADRLPSPA